MFATNTNILSESEKLKNSEKKQAITGRKAWKAYR